MGEKGQQTLKKCDFQVDFWNVSWNVKHPHVINCSEVLSRLEGPNGFCSHYHSSTHTLTCESQGHWVQRVQSGSITPCSQWLKFSSLVIKLAHLYFLLDCFEERGQPGSKEVTASGSESKLNKQTQGTSRIVVSSTHRKHTTSIKGRRSWWS